MAVTGVDAADRALREAGRATHLDFAAPGADLVAALPGKGYHARSGDQLRRSVRRRAPCRDRIDGAAGGGSRARQGQGGTRHRLPHLHGSPPKMVGLRSQ